MAIRLQVLYQQRPQDMLQIISQSIVADVLPRPTPALVSIPSSASISEAIQVRAIASRSFLLVDLWCYGRF